MADTHQAHTASARIRAYVGTIVAAAALAAPANAEKCLSYALHSNTTLSGVEEMRTFPGPPNFASVEKGDLKDVEPILLLAKPVCVDGNTGLSHSDVTVRSVRELQLLIPDALRSRASVLVGKVGSWRGHLMHAQTASHRTAVLMIIEAIE